MPDWCIAFISGAATAWFTQYVSNYFQRSRFWHERLIDRYAEFAAILSRAIRRLRAMQSTLALGVSGDHAPFTRFEQERGEILHELSRVAWQIRLLEPHRDLAVRTTELVTAQPFVLGWPGDYFPTFEEFTTAMTAFEQACNQLLDAVAQRHREWFGGW